ncbi:MAG: hypothetical protein ACTSQF_13845 [Candidatus Heimdallarchaeaceae archaeon]
MPSTHEESIPSEKMREMKNGKVVVQAKNGNEISEEDVPLEKKKFPVYHLVSELILLLVSVVSFSIILVQPEVFFDIYLEYGHTYETYALQPWVFILVLPATAIALLNTYLYIFKLEPKHRGMIFIVRLLTMVSFATLPLPLWSSEGYYYTYQGTLIILAVLIIYTLASHFVLRIFMLTTDKKIKHSLLKKAIAGSPAELEWRKYHTLSGYLAIFTGIIGVQFLWLIYHGLIRPSIVKTAKRRLVVNSLNFEEEVNLSTVALDLGISLEETIFTLKQLQLKRHLTIEFTRYGAKLDEIRKAKWFSIVLQEKYDIFLGKQKMSEYEMKANHFIELTERTKINVEDFRRLMGFNEEFTNTDFILYLPPRVASIRKPLFSSSHYIFLSHNQALLRREKIIKVFLENGDKMFAKSKTTTPRPKAAKTPTSKK